MAAPGLNSHLSVQKSTELPSVSKASLKHFDKVSISPLGSAGGKLLHRANTKKHT